MATTISRLQTLITDLGTDWKNIWAAIGTGALNTTAQNLRAAINEVKATADAAVAGTAPDADTTTKGIIEIATDAEVLAGVATDKAVVPSNITAIVNVANGLAQLDGSGKLPVSIVPGSYDDVVEAADFASLPGAGETGKLYVTLDDDQLYRWSGSVYVALPMSPGTTDDVPEGATNLYYTNARADARADGRITALIGDPDTDLAALYTAAKA